MTKANNGRKRTNVPKKRSPMVTRIPRAPRPKVNFDGQILNGTGYAIPISTLVNSASGVYTIDVSSLNGTGAAINMYEYSVCNDLLAIARLYNEYIYRSVTMHWIPAVAPGVADGASQIYVSYIDNAEDITNLLTAATPGPVFNASKNPRNSRFFNAWERFSYTIPLSSRRKTFDVNAANNQTVDVVDRSVQGAIVTGYTSLSAAINLGQWRVTYSLELRNLNVSINT